jgi:hypothetical protein
MIKRGCGNPGTTGRYTNTPPGSRRRSGDMEKVRINPKERDTAGNVIMMAGKQNLANLFGKHIRCIVIRGTGCE